MSNPKLQYCGLHLHKDKFKTYYDLIKYYHLSLPCNSFQLFLNSPYTLKHDTTITVSDTMDVSKYIKKNNIHLICHSGYLINLCSPNKRLVKLMIENISKDLQHRYQYNEKNVIIEGKTANIKETLDNIENQLAFFSDSIKTIDNILYGVKTRVEIEKALGL